MKAMSSMPRKIVVPVDLSHQDSAETALAHARQYDADADIVLLHVVPHIPEYYATNIPDEVLRARTENVTEELREFAKRNGISDDSQIVVREGAPGREILDYTQAAQSDLVVMASHDPRWGDMFLGSVAAFVVRHAHCSVFVVRPRAA